MKQQQIEDLLRDYVSKRGSILMRDVKDAAKYIAEGISSADLDITLKALKVIESIAVDSEDNLEKDCEYCTNIFRMAHAGRLPSCRDSHPDWEKEIHERYKEST